WALHFYNSALYLYTDVFWYLKGSLKSLKSCRGSSPSRRRIRGVVRLSPLRVPLCVPSLLSGLSVPVCRRLARGGLVCPTFLILLFCWRDLGGRSSSVVL